MSDSKWKWDKEHELLLVSYVLGFVLAVAPSFIGKRFDVPTLTGAALLLAAGVRGFYKQTPKDAGEAFADGQIEGNADKAGVR